MSYIPNQAIPHTYVHEDEDEDGARRRNASGERSSALVIAGGALLGYLLYRVLR